MSVNNLKPCPFCGGEARYYLHYIQCFECLANVPFKYGLSQDDGKDKATASWNRRANGWISVGDRLPEEYNRVLAFDGENIYFANLIPDYGWAGDYRLDENSITHWMSLPAPPEGVDRG